MSEREAQVITTDGEIDAALERASLRPARPRAISAEYHSGLDVIVIHIDNGHRLVIPREDIQGLENATEEQLSKIDIYSGADIDWPFLGVNHYIYHFLEGKYASNKWKKARRQEVVTA